MMVFLLKPKHVASKNLVLVDGFYFPSTVYIYHNGMSLLQKPVWAM